MQVGDAIPDVIVTVEGADVSLATLPMPLVVYFYPKDDTPGCTREAQDFTALAPAFAEVGVTVIGVSKDSPAAHGRFAVKHGLGIRLGSDERGAGCAAFGVWGEKKLYGKTYMGIERATFLFGSDGRLSQSWRKVKVSGHAEAILAAAKTL